jgi:hypothetical protein
MHGELVLSKSVMAPSHPSAARDRDRTSALTAGLSVIVIGWTFVAAFAPEKVESLSNSPWVYGPAATAAWGLFSVIAYQLFSRGRRRRAPLESHEGYRCREFPVVAVEGSSVCASRAEKNRLAAVTAGFALTIGGWVTALSFMPNGWLDWLGKAPAWIYCIVSVVLWATWSGIMYVVFRASRPQWR